MTNKEYKENISMIKKFRREILVSKVKSRNFLVKCGIVDKYGNLKDGYK